MAAQLLPYYLPETVLRVHGTKRTVRSLKNGADEVRTEASIDLEIEADPDDYFVLDLDRSGLTEIDFTLEFTDDMRLQSANAVATGRGGAVLEGTAKILGQLAGWSFPFVAMALSTPPTTPPATVPTTAAPVYPGELRRRNAKHAVTELSDRIVELGPKVAAGTPGARRLLHDTTKALAALRDELTLIEAHYALWKEKERNARIERHEYRIPLRSDLVPAKTDLPVPASASDFAGATAAMFTHLSMVVAHETFREKSPGNDPARTAPGTGHEVDGIWFRRPYYTDLVLMRYEPLTSTWQEVDRTRRLVVTQESPMSYLPLDKDTWGKRTLDVEFSELGMATKVATKKSSGAADVASSLAGIPTHVTSGLGEAAALEAGFAKVPDARLARAVARLEAEQKMALADLDDEAPGDAALVAEVKRLENRKKRLELLEELGRELD